MVDIGRGGLEAPADRNRLPPEPTLTSLVSGIVNDVQELSKQQLALFKAEVTADLRKTREVAVSWSIGLAVVAVGGLMLCLALVHLINWATGWPEWAGYAIVGTVGLAVGAALYFAGKKKLESFSLLPTESIHALKENVQCLTNRT